MLTTEGRRGPKPNPHTRSNLVRAGARMLHQAGFASTGVKEIVDAAGVPKGSFYNHFDSKESFAREVIDFYFEQGLNELSERFLNPEVEPLERLRNYFEDSCRRFEAAGYVKGCMLGNMSLEVADHSALIRDRLAMHFETWSKLFEACIEEAQQKGFVRNQLPAAVLAEFLLNSWEGALLRMRSAQSSKPMKDFIDVVFTSLLI